MRLVEFEHLTQEMLGRSKLFFVLFYVSLNMTIKTAVGSSQAAWRGSAVVGFHNRGLKCQKSKPSA